MNTRNAVSMLNLGSYTSFYWDGPSASGVTCPRS